MQRMTIKEYATLRGITEGAVRKAIMMNHKLPGVAGREKFGKSHVLHVDKKKLLKSLEVTK